MFKLSKLISLIIGARKHISTCIIENLFSMGTLCSSSKIADHTSSIDLSQKQLTKLNELTNITENDILIYYRQFMTISPNGRMTQAQFDDQLKMLRASTDRSQAIFLMIDKDNSGQISFQEYLQSIATFSQQSQP